MIRFFTYQDDNSDKFWEIEVDSEEQKVKYGRTGTRGQTKTKIYETPEHCNSDSIKLINEKIRKGYKEVFQSNSMPDEIIFEEIGGCSGVVRFDEDSNMTLFIIDMPFFNDENDIPIENDDDFPELDEFENIIAKFIGKPVLRDDREVFILEKFTFKDIGKLKDFIENYWTYRDNAVRAYSEDLFQSIVEVRNRRLLKS
jgi:predicted DNA-binding WGR domain protein